MPLFCTGLNIPDQVENQGLRNISLRKDLINIILPRLRVDECFLFAATGLLQLYVCSEERDAVASDFNALLQEHVTVPREFINTCQFQLHSTDAAAEFLRSAIGMTSYQTAGHTVEAFRKWFDVTRNSGFTGPYLNWLYQRSLWLSEKVRMESNLYRSSTTTENVATDLARKVFGSFKNHSALILSTGLTGERYIKKLVDHDIGQMFFSGADESKMNDLVNTYRGSFIEFSKLAEILPRVDLIFILDQESEKKLSEIKLKKVLDKRKHGPLFVMSNVAQLNQKNGIKRILSGLYNAFVYDRNDLEQILSKNLQERKKVTDLVDQLIESEIQDFTQWVQANEQYRFGNIIGRSKAMQGIMEMIARIAQTDISVLIDGESGTGKELIAKAIHQNSRRKDQAFIVVNCGAIPDSLLESELFGHVRGAFTGATDDKKGLFQVANHGTIFLDEIGETSLAMQVKLLRFLQEGEIKPVGSNQTQHLDVRLLTATNRDLQEMAATEEFRQDLYYRLNVIQITIPPLRERRDDILPLAEYAIRKYSEKMYKNVQGISDEVRQTLLHHDWPGNVRELENAMERAVALASDKLLEKNDLPPSLSNSLVREVSLENGPALSLKEVEQQHITRLLKQHDWNYDLVTQLLGIGRTTLWRKMKEYNISSESGN